MDYRHDFLTKHVNGLDLKIARQSAGISRQQAALVTGLHRTSYLRQENGQSRVSLAAYRLLLVIGGYAPDSAFNGWRFCDGAIYSPENQPFTPGDIQSIHWLHQSIRFLRGDLYAETGRKYDQSWFHGYRFSRQEDEQNSDQPHQLDLIAL